MGDGDAIQGSVAFPALRHGSRLGGGLAIAGGIAALLGWQVDSGVLKSLVPGQVAMNPLTALCFIASGVSLLLFHASGNGSFPWKTAARVGGVLVAVAGAVILAGYFLGIPPGIDALLFREQLEATGLPHPNRMAPNTALNFLVAGCGLALLGKRAGRGQLPSQHCALAVMLLAWMVLLGYAYKLPRLYGIAPHIPMALNTALAFLALGLGLFLAEPAAGLMRVITGPGGGGLMARRLLPAAVLIPTLAGFLRVLGERRGWYDTDLGAALAMVVNIAVFLAIVLWNAAWLERLDEERACLLREREEQARRLKAANEELEAFSYSVSHDLRAPLRHMDGFTRILQTESAGRLDAEGRRRLDLISGAAKRMNRLIDDLLSFSRAGRAEMRRREVDPAVLVQEARRELEPEAAGRDIVWNVGELPRARADPALLKQVFLNLLGNAVKYTRGRAPARIEVGCRGTENNARVFFVRDNGAGFDMRHAHKLFGVFQRLHREEEFEGTGIGLANVRRIIARHGGRTWAEGEPDAGATFFFTLPA